MIVCKLMRLQYLTLVLLLFTCTSLFIGFLDDQMASVMDIDENKNK